MLAEFELEGRQSGTLVGFGQDGRFALKQLRPRLNDLWPRQHQTYESFATKWARLEHPPFRASCEDPVMLVNVGQVEIM